MMRMLNRYRADLGVRASPQEMAVAIARTETAPARGHGTRVGSARRAVR